MKDSQRRAMFAKKNQKILIKFPTEKPEPYLKNQTVHVDPVLKFEGKLQDGRPVIHKNKDTWVYYV